MKSALRALRNRTRDGGNISGALPVSAHPKSDPDGSGRAVKMDAPIVRSIKGSSTYTRATYGWLLGSIVAIWFGIRNIRYNHASIWLDCQNSGCEVSITPPGRYGTTKINIVRDQLVRAEYVKMSKDGRIVQNYGDKPPPTPTARAQMQEEMDAEEMANMNEAQKRKYRKKQKKYKNKADNRSGPDADGNYDSYVIVLKDRPSPTGGDGGASSTDPDLNDPGAPTAYGTPSKPLSVHDQIGTYVTRNPNDSSELLLSARQFYAKQTRRRTRRMVSKINSFARKRRHKVTIRENKSVSWIGVVSIVLGVFSLLMSILLGQFMEPDEDYYHPYHKSPYRSNTTGGKPKAGAAAKRRAPSGGEIRKGGPGTRGGGGGVSGPGTRRPPPPPPPPRPRPASSSTSYGNQQARQRRSNNEPAYGGYRGPSPGQQQ